MHPLLLDVKSIGFDEIENRIAKLTQRLIGMRQNQMMAHEAYSQIELILQTLMFEKQERLQIQLDQMTTHPDAGVVLSTDPLPEEIEAAKQKAKPKPKQYTII